MMTKRERFYPEDIARIGEHSIQMVKSGVIRNHKLGNSAREHTGETEETRLQFLPEARTAVWKRPEENLSEFLQTGPRQPQAARRK